jgi:WD40 repeat protein
MAKDTVSRRPMPGLAIRNIATSHDGSLVALAEIERRVYVWDLKTRSLVSSLTTTVGFLGGPLAITSDGRHCITGAYYVHGIAAYTSKTGREIWRRKDLKKVASISVSRDGKRLLCGIQGRSFQILDRKTGSTITKLRGVKHAWESPYEPVELAEKRDLRLCTSDNKPIATIPRVTFAVLHVAFGPQHVCVSESTGPVRCLDTGSGDESWRFTPQRGLHVLRLAYCESDACFVGVAWPYEHGGSKLLLRFNLGSGRARLITQIGEPCENEFCQKGSRLITSDGTIWDVSTGKVADCFAIDR